jgi:hypothetical protein
MIKPISPSEVIELKKKIIPDEVIEIWNRQIAEKYDKMWGAKIIQADIVTLIADKMDVTRKIVYDKGWVDVEDIYRAEGWKVTYDRPGYDETYDAFFTFSDK